uniref:YfhD family protein n=1 Tax=Panagrolaimus sp. JU765 TaxID=591449 RepID=A0AC34RN85_9BILA
MSLSKPQNRPEELDQYLTSDSSDETSAQENMKAGEFGEKADEHLDEAIDKAIDKNSGLKAHSRQKQNPQKSRS